MTDERFGFGANWRRFIDVVDDERLAEAERSLKEWLGPDGLQGKTFLDAGSGSGLFSLAAVRLGARTVVSFDYDPESVAATTELRRRFGLDDADWTVQRGDVLDESYVRSLGAFDVVYAWGVLHHTGQMWRALRSAGAAVGPSGRLFVAIYNRQRQSGVWTAVKRIYNRLPPVLRVPYAVAVGLPRELAAFCYYVLRLRPQDYVRRWTHYRSSRGMSRWHDLLDWVGGYPFEVAKPEEVFDFYRQDGFELERLRTVGGRLGNNEFLFRRRPEDLPEADSAAA